MLEIGSNEQLLENAWNCSVLEIARSHTASSTLRSPVVVVRLAVIGRSVATTVGEPRKLWTRLIVTLKTEHMLYKYAVPYKFAYVPGYSSCQRDRPYCAARSSTSCTKTFERHHPVKSRIKLIIKQ